MFGDDNDDDDDDNDNDDDDDDDDDDDAARPAGRRTSGTLLAGLRSRFFRQ